MRLSWRFISLKILAAMAMGIFVYAGAITLRAALFGADGGLFALLFFAMVILSGHLSGWYFWTKTPKFALHMASSKFASFLYFMLHIKNGTYFTAAVAAWLALLLPLMASLLLYRQYGFWRILFEILLTMLAYIMSLKHSRLSFAQILQKNQVYIGFIILAVSLEVSYFMKDIFYLRPWLFGASYFFILAFLIIKNQEDIDNNIFNKKHVEKSILPKNLRRFNTLSVCVVFLVILLFFNFKTIVSTILRMAVKLIFFIMEGVLWILSLIFPSSQGGTQQGGAPQGFDFFGESTELINPLKNLLSNTIKYFIILYITYRLLAFLYRKIPGLVRRAIEWIKRILSIKKGEVSLETMDYRDETETVKPVRKHENHGEMKKKMRKSRRDLRSVTDPVERVRYMYSSILHMLPLLGVQREPSDTTMELVRKTSSVEIVKELSPFTGIYNQVRYGGKVPDALMLDEAEGHYDKVADLYGIK